jgi:hypothetical protein
MLHDICVLLGYYAALCGKCSPMFQDDISVSPSRVKNSKKKRKPASCNAVYIWEGVGGDW